jgi:FKBP-type peptidyl-prolyl cis-trans isomerase
MRIYYHIPIPNMTKSQFNTAIGVGAALITLGFLFYGNLFMSFLSPSTSPNQINVTTEATGVQTQDTSAGSGAIAAPGDTVTVHYVGTLTDGKVFDSSRDRGQPFTFVLGAGDVIKGWDQGVVGMKVGGTRRLTIAPDYGYGDRAVGPIPANSTLVFEVELLGVQKPQ